MRLVNFLRILLVTAVLSGYSAWVLKERPPKKAEPYEMQPGAEIPLWDLENARILWHDPSTVFVDVRSRIDYDFGHIAGAVSLPKEEFDHRFSELKPRLERANTIVVYCKNVDCGKSLWTAILMRQAGLEQTGIFPEGWNQWYLHELPTEGTGR
jgi:rhodanese-related sulfurtransferase